MYLYLDLEKDKLHIVSNTKIEGLELKEIEVKNNFMYQKKITHDNITYLVDLTASEILEKLDYQDLRFEEYPPIEEQLDMIYKDMQNGTTIWQDLITDIKSKYPKESE